MQKRHRGFWLDLLSKIGAPVIAATLVGCILKEEVKWQHMALLLTGLALVYLGHRLDHHSEP
ncbi:MAG: hypothetical protein ACI9HE_003564 [Planctomycetota bacterium]|jgi:hypothetical protein